MDGETRKLLERLVQLSKSISTDLLTAHQSRGNGASEWMVDDDRDLRQDFRGLIANVEAALATPPETAPVAGDGWQKLPADREHVLAVAIHHTIEGDCSMLQRLEREAMLSAAPSPPPRASEPAYIGDPLCGACATHETGTPPYGDCKCGLYPPRASDADVTALVEMALRSADEISARIMNGDRYRATISDVEELRNHVRKLAAALSRIPGATERRT